MPVLELEKPLPAAETLRRPRMLYLDILRCYAIISVVFLHAMVPFYSGLQYFGSESWFILNLINPICRTGVPVFFMISGHLLLSDPLTGDFKKFYFKRLPRLLIPLLFWNAVYYLYYSLVLHRGGGTGNFFAQLINEGTSYHIWYMYTLVGIYLLAPFLKKIVDTCTKGQITGFFFLITAMTTIRPFVNSVTPFYMYLFEPLVQGYVGFFILGYLVGSTDFSRWQRLLFYLGGAFGCFINIFLIQTRSTPEAFDFSINAGTGIPRFLIAAAIFVLARQIFGNYNGLSAAARTVSKYAGLAFGIYWIHVIVLEEIQSRLVIDAIPITVMLIRFVLVIIISSIIALIMSLIKPVRKYLM